MALKQKELTFDFFKIEQLKKKTKSLWLKKLSFILLLTLGVSFVGLMKFSFFVTNNTMDVISIDQTMGKPQIKKIQNEIDNLLSLIEKKNNANLKKSNISSENKVNQTIDNILNQTPSIKILNDVMLELNDSSISKKTKDRIAQKVQIDIKILYQKMITGLEVNLKKSGSFDVVNILSLEEYKSVALYELSNEYGKIWLKAQEQLDGKKEYLTKEQLDNSHKKELELIWLKNFKESKFYQITKYE